MFIDPQGKAKGYIVRMPVGGRCVGTVRDGPSEGALVSILDTGEYFLINRRGSFRLNSFDVAAAMAEASNRGAYPAIGRASDGIQGMRLRSVSLDDHTVSKLKGYGEGNISLGIRKAARLLP